MAIITNITQSNLVNEAFIRCGIPEATSDEKTRAGDYFLQEILNDIWQSAFRDGNTRLKTLQETLLDTSVSGKKTLALGEVHDEELVIEIGDGSRYATAQDGGSSTITLEADDTSTTANAEGRWIFITGGTGVDQIRQITSLDTTTLIATVDSAWATEPDVTSTYLIIDRWHEVDEVPITEIESGVVRGKGRPREFAKYAREMIFDRAFDRSTYCVRMRYYQNVHEIDRTEGATTIYTRILQNWQTALIAGVMWKIFEDKDDNRQIAKAQEYESKKTSLLTKEIPYGGEFEGMEVV